MKVAFDEPLGAKRAGGGANGEHFGVRGRIVVRERAVAGWKKAGFRAIKECEPDDEHLERWLLMEFHR